MLGSRCLFMLGTTHKFRDGDIICINHRASPMICTLFPHRLPMLLCVSALVRSAENLNLSWYYHTLHVDVAGGINIIAGRNCCASVRVFEVSPSSQGVPFRPLVLGSGSDRGGGWRFRCIVEGAPRAHTHRRLPLNNIGGDWVLLRSPQGLGSSRRRNRSYGRPALSYSSQVNKRTPSSRRYH